MLSVTSIRNCSEKDFILVLLNEVPALERDIAEGMRNTVGLF